MTDNIYHSFNNEEREKLLYDRSTIYYILYRSGLHETADMFWKTWNMYYEQRVTDSYRIIRV